MATEKAGKSAGASPRKNRRPGAPRKGRKVPVPKLFIGFIVLVFVAAGSFIYVMKHRQTAENAAHPRLTHYVLDDSIILSQADKNAMEARLGLLDRQGRAQAIVVAVPQLRSGVIAQDALEIARRYRVGHAGRDDGVVLFIAANDRKARIEVGYGLEGTLTDAQSRLIIGSAIEPSLSQGDVSGAARRGVEALAAALNSEPAASGELDASQSLGQQSASAPEPVASSEATEMPVGEPLGIGWLLGVGLFMLVFALVIVGFVQVIVLAIPGMEERIGRSKRWGWFARVRIIGGSSGGDDNDRGSSSSSTSNIDSGGSFGGGGANN